MIRREQRPMAMKPEAGKGEPMFHYTSIGAENLRRGGKDGAEQWLAIPSADMNALLTQTDAHAMRLTMQVHVWRDPCMLPYKDGHLMILCCRLENKGDTFCACVLHVVLTHNLQPDIMDSHAMMQMLRFANAAASIVTTRRGALHAMPSVEEIKAIPLSPTKHSVRAFTFSVRSLHLLPTHLPGSFLIALSSHRPQRSHTNGIAPKTTCKKVGSPLRKTFP